MGTLGWSQWQQDGKVGRCVGVQAPVLTPFSWTGSGKVICTAVCLESCTLKSCNLKKSNPGPVFNNSFRGLESMSSLITHRSWPGSLSLNLR